MSNCRIYIYYAIIITVVFSSCTKQYDVGIIPHCRVASVADASNNNRLYLLTYNASGKLQSVYDSSKQKGYKFLYSGNYVEVQDTNKIGPAQPQYKLLLGSNGYASMKFEVNSTYPDTVFYHYNTEGYLDTIKRHSYLSTGPNYTLWFEIESKIVDGNVVSFNNYRFDETGKKLIFHSLQVDYFSDIPNHLSNLYFFYSFATSPITYDSETVRLDFLSLAGLLGKPNKNKIRRLNLENGPYFEYSYENEFYGNTTQFHQTGLDNTILPAGPNLYTFTYTNCND